MIPLHTSAPVRPVPSDPPVDATRGFWAWYLLRSMRRDSLCPWQQVRPTVVADIQNNNAASPSAAGGAAVSDGRPTTNSPEMVTLPPTGHARQPNKKQGGGSVGPRPRRRWGVGGGAWGGGRGGVVGLGRHGGGWCNGFFNLLQPYQEKYLATTL